MSSRQRLDRAKGVAIGKTYLNRMSGIEFARVIGKVFLADFKLDFFTAKFFGICLDESTDVYRNEQCVLYVRYSINGKINTRFLAIDNVQRPNSEQLTNLVLDVLKNNLSWTPPEVALGSELIINEEEVERNNDTFEPVEDGEELPSRDTEDLNEEELELAEDIVDFNDTYFSTTNIDEASNYDRSICSKVPLMVGITTDGASVLLGTKNGVQKKLKDLCNKHIIGTHCLSHRVQLAIKDAWKENPVFNVLQNFFEQLFVFHKTSAVITSAYRTALDVMGIKCKLSFSFIHFTFEALATA